MVSQPRGALEASASALPISVAARSVGQLAPSMTAARAHWCDLCHTPLLQTRCGTCGRAGRVVSTANMRPVFAAEIKLLRRFGLPIDLVRATDLALWEAAGRYYLNGSLVARARYGNGGGAVSLDVAAGVRIQCARMGGPTARLASFVAANEATLVALEHEACGFIEDVFRHYPNRLPLVSFSGGKDSTVVSHLVERAVGRRDIIHLFADTGIEMPDTYAFLAEFRRRHPAIPLLHISPANSFFELCREIGPPSRIQRWCCSTQKAAPLGATIGALAAAGGVLTFDGIRSAESARRSRYERLSAATKVGQEILASPILAWSDLAVWAYTLWRGLPTNQAYKKGFKRVGCLYCPLNSLWSEALFSLLYAREHARWQEVLRSSALGMGHPDPDQFARESWRVRAGGRGLSHDRASIASAPCDARPDRVAYSLSRDWDDCFWAYLAGLGKVRIVRDDGTVVLAQLDTRDGDVACTFRVVRPRRRLEVTYGKVRYARLLRQRVERQIRKFQSCVRCGACSAVCPVGAISVNAVFHVDPDRCTRCLKCVSLNCVAVESLTLKGKRSEVGAGKCQ